MWRAVAACTILVALVSVSVVLYSGAEAQGGSIAEVAQQSSLSRTLGSLSVYKSVSGAGAEAWADAVDRRMRDRRHTYLQSISKSKSLHDPAEDNDDSSSASKAKSAETLSSLHGAPSAAEVADARSWADAISEPDWAASDAPVKALMDKDGLSFESAKKQARRQKKAQMDVQEAQQQERKVEKEQEKLLKAYLKANPPQQLKQFDVSTQQARSSRVLARGIPV